MKATSPSNRKYKSIPADPDEAKTIPSPANGHTFTIDELEKLAGHPLLSPNFKADKELREAVEARQSRRRCRMRLSSTDCGPITNAFSTSSPVGPLR